MPEQISTVRITLLQAIERLRREPGSPSNAYDWYRKQAHRCGQVYFGGPYIAAIKVGNQWTVSESDVDSAIATHRDKMAKQYQVTTDYEAHILHGIDGSTVITDWGGYRVRDSFHFAWDSYRVLTRESDGSWYCNTCFKLAQFEHKREECHRCRDWGGCGGDCTLSRIFCSDCGTFKDM